MRCLDPYNIVRMLWGPGLFLDNVHKFALAPAEIEKKIYEYINSENTILIFLLRNNNSSDRLGGWIQKIVQYY